LHNKNNRQIIISAGPTGNERHQLHGRCGWPSTPSPNSGYLRDHQHAPLPCADCASVVTLLVYSFLPSGTHSLASYCLHAYCVRTTKRPTEKHNRAQQLHHTSSLARMNRQLLLARPPHYSNDAFHQVLPLSQLLYHRCHHVRCILNFTALSCSRTCRTRPPPRRTRLRTGSVAKDVGCTTHGATIDVLFHVSSGVRACALHVRVCVSVFACVLVCVQQTLQCGCPTIAQQRVEVK
jgi:hypothetical protein